MPGPDGIEGPCNGLTALSIPRGALASLRAAGLAHICFPVGKWGTVIAQRLKQSVLTTGLPTCVYGAYSFGTKFSPSACRVQIHIPRIPVSLAEWKLNCSFGLNSLSLMVYVIWDWHRFELSMLFIPCPEL